METKKYISQPTPDCTSQPPSFDLFGTSIVLPSNLTTLIIILMLMERLLSILKSKPAEFAIDMLRGADLQLLETLDDIAIELKEATRADRVLIAGFHNGKKNTLYHWRRVSVLAEATRLGIEPVIHKLKDIDTFSLMAVSDYEYLIKLNADKTFIHTHQDLPTISSKQKRFLLNCYMFGQYVFLLVDESQSCPHGVIFIQYDSRDKCEVDTGGEIGWSDSTRDIAYDKAMLVNSLIYDRGTSRITKILNYIKKKLRLA